LLTDNLLSTAVSAIDTTVIRHSSMAKPGYRNGEYGLSYVGRAPKACYIVMRTLLTMRSALYTLF